MEEFNLAEYIQTMLIAPSVEGRAAIPTVPSAEPTLSPRPLEASQVPTVDRGKGVYVFPNKKAPPTRLTWIVIGTPVVSVPSVHDEKEEEPVLGGVDITLTPIDIPIG